LGATPAVPPPCDFDFGRAGAGQSFPVAGGAAVDRDGAGRDAAGRAGAGRGAAAAALARSSLAAALLASKRGGSVCFLT